MLSANALLSGPRSGFPLGFTPITRATASAHPDVPDLGLDFGLLKARFGDVHEESNPHETVWVLLRGEAEVEFDGQSATLRRGNLFDEPPSALHLGPDTAVKIRAASDEVEWAVVRTPNERQFAPRVYFSSDLKPEYRGAGLVQNAALRNVRLIFDRTTRPESNLVLGEVVNYPGRWSSYPPHHHVQPEIYHYRFTAPNGYGHAELGDDVFKVRDGDTILIPPGLDHAQVSAPGYGMYYLWMIRHLPGNPYTGFTFSEEHTWTLDPNQQGWRPTDLPSGLA
jgi:5-deoxy-glucuronate isomerase